MPCVRSATSVTASGPIGCQKLGQPDPDSNLVSLLNNGLPQAPHS